MKDIKKPLKVEPKIPSMQYELAPKIINGADLVTQATKLYSSGKFNEAENLLKNILDKQPKNFNALHLMGLVFYSKGNFKNAIILIKKAIDINPKSSDFCSNLCEILRISKNYDEAILYGEKAVSLNAKSFSALCNLGLAYFDKGDLDKAKSLQENALSINPNFVVSLNNLGSVYRNLKQKDEAIKFYKKAYSISPNHLEVLNNLGAVLNELEKPDEAIKFLIQAIKLYPNFAEAHFNIANSFTAKEQTDKAEIGYKKAIELKPNYIEAFKCLAMLYKEDNKLELAKEIAEKALETNQEYAELYCVLADIYNKNAFPFKAQELYLKAIDLKPDLASAYIALGYLKTEMGKIEEAENLYNKAKEIDDNKLSASLALIQIKKISENDESFKYILNEFENKKSISGKKNIAVNFALGKAYDDLKDYDKAFSHFLEGAKLKRKTINYSAENNNLIVENICKFFTKEKIKTWSNGGCKSKLPIFVLGMPRSGTTLTEQIIASHHSVHGAGELSDLMKIACMPKEVETVGYPFSLNDIDKTDLKEMGQRYVAGLKLRNPKAKHITDKMPANFNYVGLIHVMLPNAKIIHVKRNAVDTCLSNFTKLFNETQSHSYDLFELGNFYRNYDILMKHWKSILPKDAFYEVQYEELVSDNENQARKLIEFCGLEWDDACLDFHKTERSVKTASVTQVRQPIYNSSVERWRKYEKHLKPLLDALGNVDKG
jgi:tetratricopeptide (TPR) repeat protein